MNSKTQFLKYLKEHFGVSNFVSSYEEVAIPSQRYDADDPGLNNMSITSQGRYVPSFSVNLSGRGSAADNLQNKLSQPKNLSR